MGAWGGENTLIPIGVLPVAPVPHLESFFVFSARGFEMLKFGTPPAPRFSEFAQKRWMKPDQAAFLGSLSVPWRDPPPPRECLWVGVAHCLPPSWRYPSRAASPPSMASSGARGLIGGCVCRLGWGSIPGHRWAASGLLTTRRPCRGDMHSMLTPTRGTDRPHRALPDLRTRVPRVAVTSPAGSPEALPSLPVRSPLLFLAALLVRNS